jgi:hypothetical protein
VWKRVCDKVVCEDGVWQRWCVKDSVYERERGTKLAEGRGREERTGAGAGYRIKNKNPHKDVGKCKKIRGFLSRIVVQRSCGLKGPLYRIQPSKFTGFPWNVPLAEILCVRLVDQGKRIFWVPLQGAYTEIMWITQKGPSRVLLHGFCEFLLWFLVQNSQELLSRVLV